MTYDIENLRFEIREEGVLLVTIDRPEVLNAADEKLHRALGDLWAMVDEDDDVRVTVITGSGRAFCAGGDLGMIERMTNDHEATIEQWRDAGHIVDAMLWSTKPIVAAVNGAAVGAGLAVALLSDVSIVGPSTRLSDGHVRIGVPAGDHAVLLWPLLCGMAKSKYYLMTGDAIDGTEAERIGLVTRCVPDDEVLGEALRIAKTLATGSKDAIRWTKRALNHWLRQAYPAFGESLALEMLAFLGPDAKEGVAALRAKREPRFPSASSSDAISPP